MGKKTIASLVLGLSLMVLGGLIFTGVLAVNDWDFNKLSQHKYETETLEFTEDFENISINTSTDDIVFKKSEDEKCKVVFYQDQKIKHTAKISGKTLMIGKTDTRNWYDHIEFFSFDTTKITLYLPKEIYSSLDIKTDTGDIKIPDSFSFGGLKIKGSTSDVSLNSSVSGVAEITVSTGDISVADAKFNKLKISASTGDIKIMNSDADEMFIKTDTGDVEGRLLTSKIFITNSETGTINVPKTEKGGKCEVKTSTGDIKFEISS